jgi:general stress protein CsbA
VSDTQKKNPASGFLIMAGFNLLAGLTFIVFYFFYTNANGENSFFFLVAAGVSILASGALMAAYMVFRKKLGDMGKG